MEDICTAGSKITAYQPINLYRKFKAGGIFTGTEQLSGDHVLITEEDGKVSAIVSASDAGENVETFAGLLSPGFVNCHCHIELSHLKNCIPQHTGLVDFVQAVMANRNQPLEARLSGMKNAAEELYNSGTVAVGDICNTADSLLIKQNSPLYWNNFIEVSGFVDATAEKRLAAAEEIAGQFSILDFPFSIVPHAPYSVSKKLFELLNEWTGGQLLTIHNQEEETENELYKNKSGRFLKLYENLGIDIDGFTPTGKTSFQSWLPYFTNDQQIISVHNTFISEEDLKFKIQNSKSKIAFCICINANLYIENKLPPLEMLIKNNCPIVLGTDSYASNTQLNMLEEMKQIQKYFPSIDSTTILKWATSNGATALGIDKTFGSFEPGKTPGVILIENMEHDLTQASVARRIL